MSRSSSKLLALGDDSTKPSDSIMNWSVSQLKDWLIREGVPLGGYGEHSKTNGHAHKRIMPNATIDPHVLEDKLSECAQEQQWMKIDLDRVIHQQNDMHEQFRRFRRYTEKIHQKHLQMMKDFVAMQEAGEGKKTGFLGRKNLSKKFDAPATSQESPRALSPSRTQVDADTGTTKSMTTNAQSPPKTRLPTEDANNVPTFGIDSTAQLRILITKQHKLKITSDADGVFKSEVADMAKDCDCSVNFSIRTWDDSDEKHIFSVARLRRSGNPVRLVNKVVALLWEMNKVELDILVPEGIRMELLKDQNIIHKLAEESKCEIAWSHKEATFGPPDCQAIFKGDPEKETVLRAFGYKEQVGKVTEEIFLRTLERIEPSKALPADPGILLDDEDDVDEDQDAYAKQLKDTEIQDRKAQYTLDKNEVKAKMIRYGLTEDQNKDIKEAEIRDAKEQFKTKARWRYYLLCVCQDRITQWIGLFCICLNMLIMWIEIDYSNDEVQGTLNDLQYFFTLLFFVEGMMNLVAVPQVWKNTEVFIDSVICIIAFIAESYARVVSGNGAQFLLLLRMIRFLRFFRMIKNFQGARTVRVLITGFSGALLNLVWITLFLFVLFYSGAILFKSLMKQQKGETPAFQACKRITEKVLCTYYSEYDCIWNEYSTTNHHCRDVITDINWTYFPTVQGTITTLLDSFLEGFDHSTLIARPLMNSMNGVHIVVGWLWLIYHLIMKLIVGNLIVGLFIEQLTKAAAKSDDKQQKEVLLTGRVTLETIDEAFKHCQISSSKGEKSYLVTRGDFVTGVTTEKKVRELVQIPEDASVETVSSLFHTMDHRGEGNLTFSEFAYGVLGHRCGSQSLDKMLFDNASKNLIRQSAATVKALKKTAELVEQSSSNVHYMGDYMYAQRQNHYATMANMADCLKKISTKIDDIFIGLDLERPDALDTQKFNLVNIKNVTDAKDIQGLLRDMKESMNNASAAANLQAEAAKMCLDEVLHRFRDEAKEDMRTYLHKLRIEGAAAANAASAAASAASAISATWQPGPASDAAAAAASAAANAAARSRGQPALMGGASATLERQADV